MNKENTVAMIRKCIANVFCGHCRSLKLFKKAWCKNCRKKKFFRTSALDIYDKLVATKAIKSEKDTCVIRSIYFE